MAHEDNDILPDLAMVSRGGWWRRAAGWVIVLGVLIGGAYGALRWQANKATEPPEYRTQPAEIGDITVTVTATGTLEPTNEVEVGSEISGIVDSVEVDFNDHVTVGQILARINTDKPMATVLQSKASLEVARAKVNQEDVNVDETRKEVDRLRRVRERTNGQVPSQHELDTAVAAYNRAVVALNSAKAEVARAEATLEYDQTNLEKAIIRSPIDGIVLTRGVDPGQTIAASFQAPELFKLAEDLKQMELHVDVDEADMGRVREGQEATFTVDAYPTRKFPGRIKSLSFASSTTEGVVTYEAVLTVDNHETLLRPGMTATAEIIVFAAKGALVIPNSALRFAPPAGGEQSAPSSGLLGKLLPRPPQAAKPQAEYSAGNLPGGEATIWVLRDQKLVPVAVTLGATDEKVTEVVSGDIVPGVPLVTAIVEPSR